MRTIKRRKHKECLIYFNGEAHTMTGWAKKLKISRQALYLRLKKQSIEQALAYTNRWSLDENGNRVKTNGKRIIIN
jgi:hypothetical protein